MTTDGIADLVSRALALTGEGRRVVLGIAGAPGAGKTTLAEALVARVGEERGDGWAAHVPMDGFHLADAQLARLGLLDRKGAPETFDAAGYAHALARVAQGVGEWVYVPGFERTLEQPLAAALVVPPTARLVVTEGNYLLLDEAAWTGVRRHLDEVWFVQGDDRRRVERLVARHVQFGKSPEQARAWVARSDGANAALVAPTVARADLVVHASDAGWSGLTPPALVPPAAPPSDPG